MTGPSFGSLGGNFPGIDSLLGDRRLGLSGLQQQTAFEQTLAMAQARRDVFCNNYIDTDTAAIRVQAITNEEMYKRPEGTVREELQSDTDKWLEDIL